MNAQARYEELGMVLLVEVLDEWITGSTEGYDLKVMKVERISPFMKEDHPIEGQEFRVLHNRKRTSRMWTLKRV